MSGSKSHEIALSTKVLLDPTEKEDGTMQVNAWLSLLWWLAAQRVGSMPVSACNWRAMNLLLDSKNKNSSSSCPVAVSNDWLLLFVVSLASWCDLAGESCVWLSSQSSSLLNGSSSDGGRNLLRPSRIIVSTTTAKTRNSTAPRLGRKRSSNLILHCSCWSRSALLASTESALVVQETEKMWKKLMQAN